MRIRISMPGVYMAKDLDDEKAKVIFRKMTELLLSSGNQQILQPQLSHKPEIEQGPVDAMESAPESVENNLDSEGNKIIPDGFGGFLYVKCPDCGNVKGFCAKTRIRNFRCDCGCVTRLEHMVPLYLNCECGRKARYLTNMDDSEFDMTCYDCGAPVAIGWNEKKKQYETMRG